MAKTAGRLNMRRAQPWRIIGWSIPLLLLLLPLVAMRFTDEVHWTLSDFLFAAAIFGSIGIAFEFLLARSSNLSYRVGAVCAMLAAFSVIWVNAAVGMIGSEENPYNLLFGGVLLIAILGAIIARFRASGMALTTAAAGIFQIVIAAAGFDADPRGAVLTSILAGLWLVAAALFRNASLMRASD